MRIILTTHVRQRMLERGILQKQIEEVISNPDNVQLIYFPRKSLRKKFDDKTLEIICAFEESRVIVITAYFI